MADTLSEGIIVPAGPDPISTSGVDEMRTLGATANAAVRARATLTDLAAARAQISASRAEVDQSIEATRSEFGARLDGIASAYDVWLSDGNTGSVADYLAAITGEPGKEGPYGGTSVTDPQVASYVAAETETRAALDRSYRRGISVTEFGALGDGMADDTAAFNAALASGQAVYVPAGDYRVSGAVATGPVDLHLAHGATLIHDGEQSCLHVQGSEQTPVSLTSDVGTGGTRITAPGHGLAAGDWIRLASERIWDAHSTGIRHGELMEVASVDGDVITTVTAVAGGPYTVADSARVSRLDLVVGVSITGPGTIRGSRTPSRGQTGIRLTLAQNITISEVNTRDIDYRHIALEDVIAARIDGVSQQWAHSSGMGYGISPTNAAQDILITGCTFSDIRHAFTTSNQAAVAGIVRRATVRDCTIRYSAPATGGSPGDALDTHTASEDIAFESNVIIGASGLGINMEGRSGRIVGNTIIRPGGGGISVHNESDLTGSVEVAGNLVVASGHYAIRVSPPTRGSTATLRGVIVSGNTVKDNPVNPILIGATTGATLHAVTVQGNVSINSGTSRMITVDNAAVIAASGNVSDSAASAVIVDERNTVLGDDPGFTIRTIADGAVAITPATRYLRLGSASGDELRTITGGSRGQIISVRLSSNTATVPITTGTGSNIGLTSAMSLSGANDTITLGFTGSSWIEVSRAKF